MYRCAVPSYPLLKGGSTEHAMRNHNLLNTSASERQIGPYLQLACVLSQANMRYLLLPDIEPQKVDLATCMNGSITEGHLAGKWAVLSSNSNGHD